MTRLWGVITLRLANADIVPLDYRAYAERLREFATELMDRASPRDRDALRLLPVAIDRFARAAGAMSARVDAVLAGSPPDVRTGLAFDRALMQAERALVDPGGIPGRPWYRHLIYAPKPTYAPEVLPGVAEAIDAGDQPRIVEQVTRLVAALDRAAAALTTR